MEVSNPPNKSTASELQVLHSEWKVTEDVAYKQAKWKTIVIGDFICSRFYPILLLLKLILEIVFWTNLIGLLDFICT